MTKYRIVSKPSEFSEHYWYYAQYKFLNLIWLECSADPLRPGLHRSLDIHKVEEFIEAKRNGIYKDYSMKVVKVYD